MQYNTINVMRTEQLAMGMKFVKGILPLSLKS